MAATNGTSQDALSLLRASIASQILPIPTKNADPSTQSETNAPLAQASYLIFNTQSIQDGAQHTAIPLTQPTRFISAAAGEKPLDLRSVYFCWLNKDVAVGEYIAATQAQNEELKQAGKTETVTNLVFAEKLDLVTWLSGEIGEDESEHIKSLDDNRQTRREAADAAALAQGGGDVEMQDAGTGSGEARKREEERLREIYAGERKTGDRNTVLRGSKVQDFSDMREKYSKQFLVKSRSGAAAQNPASLTNNPAIRPSSKPQAGKRPEQPIILLSPSASSLLRMPNIKSFLEEGIYVAPEASGSSGANILQVSRLLSSVSSKPIRFILCDDPSSFRPDYWDRVVAVFTTGQTWQFKNYRWQAPAELFSHALGVYVGWKGEAVPDSVQGWGRGVMTAHIDKGTQRWRDREVVEDVWRGIESRMRAMGWGRDGR